LQSYEKIYSIQIFYFFCNQSFVLAKINIHTHSENIDNAIQNYCIGTKNRIYSKMFSAGIHPWHIHKLNIERAFDDLMLLSKDSRFVASGECGLDKFAKTQMDIQIDVFVKQIEFAENNDFPVIIHCVRCFDKLLKLRNQFSKTPWIVHDFSGSIELAKQLIKQNIFLSLGNGLMKESKKIINTLKLIDINYLFLETDTDKFTIDAVYQKVVFYKKINMKDLEQMIVNNFKRVFQK